MLRASIQSAIFGAFAVCAAALLLLGSSQFASAEPLDPIQTEDQIVFGGGQVITGAVLFQVPNGRMFVAEHVSLSLSLPAGQSPVSVFLNGGLESFDVTGTQHYLAPIRLGSFVGGQENFAASQHVRLYFPPGNNVGYQVFRTDGANAGLAVGRITISGVLLKCGKDILCTGP